MQRSSVNHIFLPVLLFVFYLALLIYYFHNVKIPKNTDESSPGESTLFLSIKDEEKPRTEDPMQLAMFREEASRFVSSMDDSRLAAQCLLAGLEYNAHFSDHMKSLLQEIPAGGIIFFRYNLTGNKDEIRSLLRDVSNFIYAVSGIPPFMAVDHEGGLVHRFGSEIKRLPAPESFWEMAKIDGEAKTLEIVETLARQSGEELWDLGINMNLAPVAEVLSPENQAFLESRSFGPDPVFTENAAIAFIRGMEAAGIICVAKHFPGNGSEDPHKRSVMISADLPALDLMIQPFKSIIRELHAPAMMVSHTVVPAIDPHRNASLSPALVSGWLREELGFSGIIVADDFNMSAVVSRGISPEEAAVQALNAGVDMVMCWPHNMESIHHAILAAIENGSLPRQRLEEAAERIIAERLRLEKIRADKSNNDNE